MFSLDEATITEPPPVEDQPEDPDAQRSWGPLRQDAQPIR